MLWGIRRVSAPKNQCFALEKKKKKHHQKTNVKKTYKRIVSSVTYPCLGVEAGDWREEYFLLTSLKWFPNTET